MGGKQNLDCQQPSASETPRVLVVDGSQASCAADRPRAAGRAAGRRRRRLRQPAPSRAARLGAACRFRSPPRSPAGHGRHWSWRASCARSAPQAYVPIVVVSGDVQDRLHRPLAVATHVTDYFDKALRLRRRWPSSSAATCGRRRPASGEVLYVEDSRVVALATARMLEKIGLTVRT